MRCVLHRHTELWTLATRSQVASDVGGGHAGVSELTRHLPTVPHAGITTISTALLHGHGCRDLTEVDSQAHHYAGVREDPEVRSGQVRFITRPESRTMSVTRQLMLPPSTVT